MKKIYTHKEKYLLRETFEMTNEEDLMLSTFLLKIIICIPNTKNPLERFLGHKKLLGGRCNKGENVKICEDKITG